MSEFVFKALYLQVPLSQVTSEEGSAQGFLGVVSIKLRQVSFIKGLIYRVCNETRSEGRVCLRNRGTPHTQTGPEASAICDPVSAIISRMDVIMCDF